MDVKLDLLIVLLAPTAAVYIAAVLERLLQESTVATSGLVLSGALRSYEPRTP